MQKVQRGFCPMLGQLNQIFGGNIYFVGHSVGGGATALNAAGLNRRTVGGKALSNGLIVHFHSSLDLLQLGNAITPGRVPGEQVPLGAAGLHGMGAVCRAMGC